MRCIGGEGELPLAHALQRATDAATDREGADEDEDEEEGAHHQLGKHQVPHLLPVRGEARPDDQTASANPPPEEPERVARDVGGDRRRHRAETRGEGGSGADGLAMAIRLDHPGQEGLIEVVVGVDYGQRGGGLGGGLRHPLAQAPVDRGGEAVGDQHVSCGEHAAESERHQGGGKGSRPQGPPT